MHELALQRVLDECSGVQRMHWWEVAMNLHPLINPRKQWGAAKGRCRRFVYPGMGD